MNVFLSYRRADSQATAARMAAFLEQVPAVKQLFFDAADIELGEDYERSIRTRMAAASHAFVLIGNAWRGSEPGRDRLNEADDVVQLEVRLALQGGVRTVPILIDDARMPAAAQLPAELQPLAKLNAFALRSAHFERDMDDLLESLLGRTRRGSRWQAARLTPLAVLRRALFGAAAGAALVLLAALVNRYLLDDCYDLVCRVRQTFDIAGDDEALGLLWLIVLAILALGSLLAFVPRWWSLRR